MKKSILLALGISSVLFGCKTDVKSTIQEKVKQEIENQAFKNNAEVDIIALDVLDYSLTNEKYLDSLRHYKVLLAINKYENLLDEAKADMKKEGNKMVKYAIFGLDNAMYKMHEANMLEKKDKASAATDSLYYYYDQDSILKENLNREASGLIYKSNVYVKLQFKNDLNKQNVLDTLVYVFDKDFNMLPTQ